MPINAKKDAYSAHAKEWVERMRSGKNIAHDYLEKPAMYGKLPDLKEKDVLCVGCGSGEECEHLKSLGANRVVGIDLSEGLIEYAKQGYPELEFQVMDMEKIDFPPQSFDFVYSSLVMHYVGSWKDTLDGIHKVLKKDGKFLLSTHHPATWGAERIRTETERTSLLGYKKLKETNSTEIVGDYLNARKIDDLWWGDFEVTYFHRPLREIMQDIFRSGFELTDFLEPKAIDACKEVDHSFWEIHEKIPIFIVIELTKRTD